MLIGGQSTHYKWNNQQVVEQIKQIVRNDATVQWTITTSRRTPESFIPLIQDLCISENLDVVPFEETDQQWMLDQFRFASQIWVTPDSVSMVYEALSSGAIVRIFLLDPKESKKVSRVVHGLQELVQESTVGTFEKWKEDPDCVTKPELFNEADRVVQIVVEQLL
jgi:mitochondrial fission protein ELM1